MKINMDLSSPKFWKMYRLVFLLVWLSGIACGSILTYSSYINGEWDPFSEPEFLEWSICTGASPETGKPEGKAQVFSISQKSIYLCGQAIANETVNIDVLVYKDTKDELIYTPPAAETLFDPGYIFVPIKLNNKDRVGRYIVDVTKGREVIATLEFEVVR